MHLEFLKIWHDSFASHIRYLVEGLESLEYTPANPGDDQACNLGKWLQRHETRFAHLGGYQTLVEAHQAFHLTAGELVQEYLAGQQNKIPSRLDAFNIASTNVILSIDVLSTQILASNLTANEFDLMVFKEETCPAPFWHDTMLLGIPEIDNQHRGLAKMIENLITIGGYPVDSEDGKKFLHHFNELFLLHCRTEELLMQRLAVPLTKQQHHKQEHELFTHKIMTILGTPADGKNLLDSLGEFSQILIEHILVDDKDLLTSATAAPATN